MNSKVKFTIFTILILTPMTTTFASSNRKSLITRLRGCKRDSIQPASHKRTRATSLLESRAVSGRQWTATFVLQGRAYSGKLVGDVDCIEQPGQNMVRTEASARRYHRTGKGQTNQTP